MFATFVFVFCVVVAYLVGSICSAIIVCRLFDLPDPRKEGSKNPGATNVLRLAGKQYAIIVLLADMMKGLLPVLLARALDASPIVVGFTCLAAVIGHMYPIFFEFKGGKGVATAIGALLGFHFILGVLVIATWLLVARITRYSSVASMTSITFAPFYSLYAVGNVSAFLPLAIIAVFILYQHRENITRLQDGTESKINFSKTTDRTKALTAETMASSPKKAKATAKTSVKKTQLKASETAAKTKKKVKAAPKKSTVAKEKPPKAKKTAPKKKVSPKK